MESIRPSKTLVYYYCNKSFYMLAKGLSVWKVFHFRIKQQQVKLESIHTNYTKSETRGGEQYCPLTRVRIQIIVSGLEKKLLFIITEIIACLICSYRHRENMFSSFLIFATTIFLNASNAKLICDMISYPEICQDHFARGFSRGKERRQCWNCVCHKEKMCFKVTLI
jgi:hypothetical protein